jgi:hypothetical protein
MDEKAFGSEERGQWAPAKRISYGPLLARPWNAGAVIKWFFGYPGFLFPWTVVYAALAMAIWLWLTPSLETMRTLSPGWVLFILARNLVLALIVYGGWHLWLYRWRRQMLGAQPRLSAFTPVTVTADDLVSPPPPPPEPGVIDVEIAGGTRVRVTGAPQPATIAAVLAALTRRQT